MWRHTDDQYQHDEQETPVEVRITGLNAGDYTVRHLRIDATQSNAHSVWRALGSPQDPTEDELARIRERQGLEELEPAHQRRPADGSLSVPLRLPLPAVSLLLLDPAPEGDRG